MRLESIVLSPETKLLIIEVKMKIQMKTVFRITAILNLLLVVLACICAVIAAINKSGDFFVGSALTILFSFFPTAMMLALCNDFKETDK